VESTFLHVSNVLVSRGRRHVTSLTITELAKITVSHCNQQILRPKKEMLRTSSNS